MTVCEILPCAGARFLFQAVSMMFDDPGPGTCTLMVNVPFACAVMRGGAASRLLGSTTLVMFASGVHCPPGPVTTTRTMCPTSERVSVYDGPAAPLIGWGFPPVELQSSQLIG